VAFAVTVDLVVLTIRDGELVVLVVRRGGSPYRGRWALPGGFVEESEGLLAAARRELREETGLADPAVHLEQLATYGAPRRDPRLRVVSVAYLALAAELPDPSAGSDASEATWRQVADLLSSSGKLAFDHGAILADGLERARAKLEYSPLATAFCADEFTVAELRHVYEVVWGTELDPRNFHRKVTGSPGFLEPTGKQTARNGGRPAQLYRRGDAQVLNPPISR
jgi:8-oxo-dGTP diphosphatase